MLKKKGLDSVPNKGHWGVFNAPFTKAIIDRLSFLEVFYIQINIYGILNHIVHSLLKMISSTTKMTCLILKM